ncbi:hypothetical protein GWK47_053708 [Chionoecetes opilio]|uniref:Uncharacterized protein n=1 Tax=Chionoecetes opilio TaxID=41210 RepID=A0A8J5CQG5_CHIOP|nr:hypothetical protein GWK47_053708 [Chionoecetes opilio]
MDVDEGVLWLLTALRLSRGPDGVEKEKLIQNVNSCFLRVKKERKANTVPASQASEELRDFQAKASLLLLLCLPQIRELPSVQNCEDFQSMISSLPELSEDIFFAVVRTQKTVLEAHPHLEEDLAIRDHHELLQFLGQVAADPEYDPDRDLALNNSLSKYR